MDSTRVSEIVVILDFGSIYQKDIENSVRECGASFVTLPSGSTLDEILEHNPKGIILSGSPDSVYENGARQVPEGVLECGVPILGICYGMQAIAFALGGEVLKADEKELGLTQITVLEESRLLNGFGDEFCCEMSHGDYVNTLPEGFVVTAETMDTPIAAMENAEAGLYAVQFHPEASENSKEVRNRLFSNFMFDICGIWSPAEFIDNAIAEIRREVKDAKVVCGVSGGVDSNVVAALVHKAVSNQLTCIFVDHGLMRLDEGRKVKEIFEDHFGIHLIYADAEERFLSKLAGVQDPEKKRKIIGNEFIEVFEEYASPIEGAEFLAQGTVLSDVVESGGKDSGFVKSHHNVGGLPEHMNLKIIEPLRSLYKDDVRKVGLMLGLPEDMVWRHPFPGPGLAIRIAGEVTKERLEILRKADAVAVEEIRAADWYDKLWMGFAILIPVRSVGVKGNRRTYEYTIGIRAVTSDDAMTAEWAKLPYELLETISNRIINEVAGVSRVVYDISSKPPATMEWE